MAKPQPVPSIYMAVLPDQLEKLEQRIETRLMKIVGRPRNVQTARLDFLVWWDGAHATHVHAYPTDAAGNNVSTGSPFGPLFVIEPPDGQQDNPHGFAAEKPTVANAVVAWLADWWHAAGGGAYPLPAVLTIQDDDRMYDLTRRQWGADERTVAITRQAADLAGQVRERMAKLRPKLVEKFQKVTIVPPPTTIRRLESGAMEWGPAFYVGMTPALHDPSGKVPARPWSQTLMNNVQLPDYGGIDWIAFYEVGVNAGPVMKDELLRLLSDAWEEAGGLTYPLQLVFSVHDDMAEYDVAKRRWVTDFLGRPLS